MKETVPQGSIDWQITMRMNNENEDLAPILASSWKDSKVVYFLSTSHQGGENIIV